MLIDRLDAGAASHLSRSKLTCQIEEIVAELLGEINMQLNRQEQWDLVEMLLDEMLGLGPLEPLLADETVTDIMVNGARQIYVERHGKLERTDVLFHDYVMNVASRIVTRIGHHINESTLLVATRLADGNRANVIISPLAIDGLSISIRKFAKKQITLERMVEQKNLSAAMTAVLQIASRAQLNILISGGTGAGKTTLLDALLRMIGHGERVVTIEDAAELRLQQPHVGRLETRLPNIKRRG